MGRIDKHDGRAWRARAAECRAIADTFQNPETREKMYVMAADYERMAENADRRAQEEATQVTGSPATSRPGTVGSASRDLA